MRVNLNPTIRLSNSIAPATTDLCCVADLAPVAGALRDGQPRHAGGLHYVGVQRPAERQLRADLQVEAGLVDVGRDWRDVRARKQRQDDDGGLARKALRERDARRFFADVVDDTLYVRVWRLGTCARAW